MTQRGTLPLLTACLMSLAAGPSAMAEWSGSSAEWLGGGPFGGATVNEESRSQGNEPSLPDQEILAAGGTEGNPALPYESEVVLGPYLNEGFAAWYGPGKDGLATATGVLYRDAGRSAAMFLDAEGEPIDLPALVWVVCDSEPCQGRALKVLVNDRGPFETYIAGEREGQAIFPLRPLQGHAIALSAGALIELVGATDGPEVRPRVESIQARVFRSFVP